MKLPRQSSGQQMSTESMSGHMNDDFSAPSSASKYKTPGPGRLRGVETNTNRNVKVSVEISDISADQHGSWINGVMTPNNVKGFPFKVYES